MKGLVAGFDLDLTTAMHLLMPQVENAIRCLAELCGAVVYKTDCNGIEKCISHESILKLKELEESIAPELLFNMRMFYTSPYGIGMRDVIGHGLRSDKGLQSADCLAVWWFTLHLVCLFISLVSTYKNNFQKSFDPLAQCQCSVCKSKMLNIEDDESDEDGKIDKLYLHCEECGATTEAVFE